MTRILVAAALAAFVLAVLALWWASRSPVKKAEPGASLPETCYELTFEGQEFIACAIDTDDYALALHLNAPDGKPYQRPSRLPGSFVLAMNAGMYHKDFTPVGLHVESGRELAPLNRGDAFGNFFMKPNGVFFVDQNGSAGVMATDAYAASGISPQLATQSGPMLVIDGEVHPRFEPDGASRFIRNGVGINDREQVVLAISRMPVSFGKFARLYRDGLSCRNALFFDGAVSALYDGSRYIVGGEQPAGPMLTVQRKGG